VERLDFEGRKAFVRAIDCDYYTDAIDYTQVHELQRFEEAPLGGASKLHGKSLTRLLPCSNPGRAATAPSVPRWDERSVS